MSQTIQVTEELIRSASQRDSRRCMIAEAIQLRNPHYLFVRVDLATIRWTNPRTNKRYIALTPEDAALALIAFDRGDEDIEPFSLTLKPIQVTPLRARKVLKRDDEGQLVLGATGKPITQVVEPQRLGRKRVVQHSRGERIEGGLPLPTGHLPGTAFAVTKPSQKKKREWVAPPEGDNVKASRNDFRVFGRRLLRQ